MNLNASLALAYAALWPLTPRNFWRWPLTALPIAVVCLNGLDGEGNLPYGSAVLIILVAAESVLSLCYMKPPVATGKAATEGALVFIRVALRPKGPQELDDDGSITLRDLFTQLASYGSFVAWCAITFCFFSVREMNESWFQVSALTLCASITLFQVPTHAMAASCYTHSPPGFPRWGQKGRYGAFELTMLPLNWAPIVAVSLVSISLAMRWFVAFDLAFILYVALTVCAPLLVSLLASLHYVTVPREGGKGCCETGAAAVDRGTRYWWELRRFAEMLTWMVLASPVGKDPQPHETEEMVLAVLGFAFGVVYLVEFFVFDMWDRFVRLASERHDGGGAEDGGGGTLSYLMLTTGDPAGR